MTLVLKINKKKPEEEKLRRAADVIKRGGLVAFPTETVYGLGADAYNPEAVRRIYAVKGRPGDNPLIVHIADPATLDSLVRFVPHEARTLCERFWPGPLTLVFDRREELPPEVSAGLSTVAVRMPANPIALGLIRAAGTPLVAPSANLSSRPSPTRAGHVLEDLGGLIDLIIDGGKTAIGMESTVVDFTAGPPRILRPGAVTAQDIAAAIGSLASGGELSPGGKPKAPGMKYRHYAPRTRLVLMEGKNFQEDIRKLIDQSGKDKQVAVIAFHKESRYEDCLLIQAGFSSRTVARRLFDIFRDLDSRGVDLIIAEPYPATDGLDSMIWDRLKKAAGSGN